MKFIDEVTIEVASGHGGPGCVSFRREMFVPRGGPDGGDGGKGGDIIFRTSTRVHSLLDLKIKNKYYAQPGDPGKNQKRAGADASDLVIVVPIGTIIKSEDGRTLKDLDREQDYIFLEGGIGGKGNPFYQTSVNQTPGVAQKGMPGKTAKIKLELKLIADVGIIGFPNAGKSTLISHISAAKPKVADYPFTTLIPNLGVVRYTEESHFIVADMPGLIKGASHGVGLGTRFLRHIERTKCFVHLIDASGMSERDPLQDFKDINYELSEYDKRHQEEDDFKPLHDRKQIVVLNKADVLTEEIIEKLKEEFSEKLDVEVIVISAATGRGLDLLIKRMGEMVFNENHEKDQIKKEHAIVKEVKKQGHPKGQASSKTKVHKGKAKRDKDQTKGKAGSPQNIIKKSAPQKGKKAKAKKSNKGKVNPKVKAQAPKIGKKTNKETNKETKGRARTKK